jgi:hypothetical protein
MNKKDPRTSIDNLTADAQRLGYQVREGEQFLRSDGKAEIMMDIEGHGELFEAYFIQNKRTGYWRFRRGFRHVGIKGDWYTTLEVFRALLRWSTPDTEEESRGQGG